MRKTKIILKKKKSDIFKELSTWATCDRDYAAVFTHCGGWDLITDQVFCRPLFPSIVKVSKAFACFREDQTESLAEIKAATCTVGARGWKTQVTFVI